MSPANVPIYLQLREVIRSKIEDGEYMPGTAIPSENSFAETYGINRLTVRNAVDALVSEGLLKRVQGKGVFVLAKKYVHSLEEEGGFLDLLPDKRKPITVKESAKVVRHAGDLFSNYFKIEPTEEIFYLRHLACIDEEPAAVTEIFIPRKVLPELSEINSSVFSMNDIFAFYDIEVCSMRQTMEVVSGMPKIRKALEMPDKVALIMILSDYEDKRGEKIQYTRSFVRSDKSAFSIKTKRPLR